MTLTKDHMRGRLDRSTPEIFEQRAYGLVCSMADALLARTADLLAGAQLKFHDTDDPDSDDSEAANIAVLEAHVIALASFCHGQFGDAVGAEEVMLRVRRVFDEMRTGMEATKAHAQMAEAIRKGQLQ